MNEKYSGKIPAENRCERNDGKGWRCKKPKAKGEKMCLYRLPKNKKDLSPEADEGEVQLKEYLPIQSKGKVPRKRKGWKPAVKDSIGDGEDKEDVGVDGIEDEESDGEEEEGKGLMRQRGRKKWKGQNSLAKNATEDDKKEENAGTDDEEEDEEEEKKRKQRDQKMSRRKKEVRAHQVFVKMAQRRKKSMLRPENRS